MMLDVTERAWQAGVAGAIRPGATEAQIEALRQDTALILSDLEDLAKINPETVPIRDKAVDLLTALEAWCIQRDI